MQSVVTTVRPDKLTTLIAAVTRYFGHILPSLVAYLPFAFFRSLDKLRLSFDSARSTRDPFATIGAPRVTEINTIYSILAEINTIYSILAEINTIHSILTEINTIYSILTEINTIYSIKTLFNFITASDGV